MTHLTFDPTLYPLVAQGKKTATIRKGARSYQVGQTYAAQLPDGSNPDRCHCTVKRVVMTPFMALTLREIDTDGAKDRQELRAMLNQYYPDLDDHTVVTYVEFVPWTKIS